MNFNFTFKSFILIFLSGLYSITITVGSDPSDDYTTIQEGIDAASDGDIVLVGDGTYTENLIIESEIILTSTGGHQSTIIDGSGGASGTMGSTVTIRPESNSAFAPNNVEIDGFTITGGAGNEMNWNTTSGTVSGRFGGGIMAFNTSPKISNNDIKGNGNASTANGGGIIAIDSAEDWSFNDRDWEYNPELPPTTSDLDFSNNIFYSNDASYGHSVFISGFEEALTDLTNGVFDCYSTEYQDVSEYWIKGEVAQLRFEGSGGVEPIYTDVWVDPETGIDQGNTIGDIEHPFRTINFALGMIYATENNPITIHLNQGTYSPSNNNEVFPIYMISNVNLIGEDENTTVLNAEGDDVNERGVISISYASNNIISDFTLTGGYQYNGIYQKASALYLFHSDPTINNITISNNMGNYIAFLWHSNPKLDNINVRGNISDNHIFHGWESDFILTNSIFSENHGFASGSISLLQSDPILSNVIINNNVAEANGVLYFGSSQPLLINMTITDNTVVSDPDQYAVIYHYGWIPEIRNSIIWGNNQLQGSNEYIYSYYNNIEGGLESGHIIDNIDVDPLFMDSQNGDYNLQADSPCIDVGDPDFWYYDLDGTRSNMGAMGGAYILPNFISHNFGEVGNIENSIDWTLYNFRETPIQIESVSFSTSNFTSNSQFPLTINPNESGRISINCLPQQNGIINDNMLIHSNNLVDGLNISLSATGSDGNLLTGNLSGELPSGIYEITGNINVQSGDTLILNPGTQFLFASNWITHFTINGVLEANGTELDSIIFDNSENNDSWGGIVLFDQTEETVFEYVRISGAYKQNWSDISLMLGGGLYLSNSNPILKHMVISNNKAQGGAGMYLADSYPIMSDIVITNNTAINNDGGITVFNNDFTDEEVLNMSNIIISENTSLFAGVGGLSIIAPNVILTNVEIINNTVVGESGKSGGLSINANDVQLIDVIISGNEGRWPGGLEIGGANLLADNLLVTNNYGRFGPGGIYIAGCNDCELFLNNSTIADNLIGCEEVGYCLSEYGAGIYSDFTNSNNFNVILTNSIVYNNKKINDDGVDIYDNIAGIFEDGTYIDDGDGIFNIFFSNVGGSWIGEGNIDQDPLFNDDYSLEENSPCIDAGTPYFEYEGEIIVDIPNSDFYGQAPDMGAIEYIPNQQNENGDLNGDGSINIIDIVALVNIILNDLDPQGADYNGDGTVNVIDVVALVQFVLNN